MVLLQVEEGCARANGRVGAGEQRRERPEDVVVVGEHGEEDAEEEACCWECVSSSFFAYVSLVMDEAFLGGLTTDDQECREGRDAAKSHFVVLVVETSRVLCVGVAT